MEQAVIIRLAAYKMLFIRHLHIIKEGSVISLIAACLNGWALRHVSNDIFGIPKKVIVLTNRFFNIKTNSFYLSDIKYKMNEGIKKGFGLFLFVALPVGNLLSCFTSSDFPVHDHSCVFAFANKT